MNIAELLKDAPKGTKLYSPLCGEVTFSGIDEDLTYCILVADCYGSEIIFDEMGRYDNTYKDAECLLFPSKDNRDWSTFKVEPKFPMGIGDCGAILGITGMTAEYKYKRAKLDALHQLIIARDAWWKVDNDWKPDWSEESDTWKYVIIRREDNILATEEVVIARTLAFRTEEIRDTFFETFRELIGRCKELI